MHELPLVFFTIFGQLAAGMVLITALCNLSHRHTSQILLERVNWIALVVMAIGMFLASFHLGRPERALNVIFGIGRSPMSNEIFIFGLLFGTTLAVQLLAYFNKPNRGKRFSWINNLCIKINQIPHLSIIISITLSVVSLFFIWTIVLTYMLPTVKTWDSYFTIIEMYSAMLILGGSSCAMLRLYRIGTWVFLVGALTTLLLKVPYLKLMYSLAPDLTIQQYGWVVAQCLLLIFATILIIYNGCRKTKPTVIYFFAFLSVLLSALCGRIVFYNLWIIPM